MWTELKGPKMLNMDEEEDDEFDFNDREMDEINLDSTSVLSMSKDTTTNWFRRNLTIRSTIKWYIIQTLKVKLTTLKDNHCIHSNQYNKRIVVQSNTVQYIGVRSISIHIYELYTVGDTL